MTPDTAALEDELHREVDGEVRFDLGSRHLYATDASAYRALPIGVVIPRTVDGLVATIGVCARHDAPVTNRGGGTSCAGQATNTAVIVDSSKYLRRVLSLDPERAEATVEPGVVLDDLQRAAARHGLMFAPDPTTQNRCTIGGMVGNNACGVHSLRGGRTSDNVARLDVVLYDGTRFDAGPLDLDIDRPSAKEALPPAIRDRLRGLRDRYADEVRHRFPHIPRRVSGFNLDDLLPERDPHLGRALTGTEGTCVTLLGATVRLIPRPVHRRVVVLGYPSIADAADDAPRVRASGCSGLEGFDHHLADPIRIGGRPARDHLPDGDAWLLVEVGGDTESEVEEAARRLAAPSAGRLPTARTYDADGAANVWKVRTAGLAATTIVPGQRPKWTGWEDAAVDPDRLGDYLRSFIALLEDHRLDGSIYGHFGDGCVHTRIGFDYSTPSGVAAYRRFVTDAADLVLAHGGSLSGEHGDGQARAELLPRMFGDDLVAAFAAFKAIFDPANGMNPGKVVDPRPLDEDLRYGPGVEVADPKTWFSYADDGGSFARAQMRCIGVGLCRRDDGAGTMCPSYMVTHEERHSTRGRARLLHEMLRGDADLAAWQDEEVREALDLCLSCKGCKVDCPVSVDMATYKSEFLAHHYATRRRPVDHYALGLAHRWVRIGARSPGIANLVAREPGGLRRLLGVSPHRPPPRFAAESFRRTHAKQRSPVPGAARRTGRRVALFVDTFTDAFTPSVARAAIDVLEDAGFDVTLAPDVCCGRPLFDHGMLDRAVRTQRIAAAALDPLARQGVPIVGLEPSCVAALRAEMPDLLADDPAVSRVTQAVRTLPELLGDAGYDAPSLHRRAIVHGHCQAKADLGVEATAALYDAVGLEWRELDAGCCGLAGSFGYRDGESFEVSMAAGERRLLPEVSDASPETLVVADGFSCRTQVEHLQRPRRALHTAEVLAMAIRTGPEGPDDHPVEAACPPDPPAPAPVRGLAAAGAGLLAGAMILRRARRG